MKIRILLLILVLSCIRMVNAQTVFDIIANSPNHTTLEAAIRAAGLEGTLSGDGPLTVFAPTDDAFAALPAGTVDALLNDIPALTSILTYHAVGATALSTDLTDGQTITTVNGKDVTITINTGGVFVNDAQVSTPDLVADNGVVHVIDAVLLPPTVTVYDIIGGSADHTTLKAAIDAAGLDSALQGEGPFTVFAPTDAAFGALPDGTIEALLNDIPTLTAILTYHVVGAEALSTDLSDGQIITTLNRRNITVTINDDGVFINNAQVTVVDLIADNGVVHVIDAVLLPPVTVYDIISGSEDHTTLKAALDAAELDGALLGQGPFTVFAPTDAAFEALPDGTIEALLNDIPTLTAILTYHVVGAEALSTDLSDGQVITSLNGNDITVTINEDGVFINDAQVTVADLVASNGVVHVIDAVLLPPLNIYDIIAGSPDHTILKAAIDAAGLDGTLRTDFGPVKLTVFAPTDAAFDALPDGTVDALLQDPDGALAEVLLYHVTASFGSITSDIIIEQFEDGLRYLQMINGKTITIDVTEDGVFINNAKVTVTDLEGTNGVVHVIDAVLLAPQFTIIDVVEQSDDHVFLNSLLENLEFKEPLRGYGPFTLFAPTDDAILALGQETLDVLLADEELLADVLLYHVVGGQALSTDLSNGQRIATLLGEEVIVNITNEGVFINNAKVTMADIITDNGVVHVIDAVLLLPTNTVYDIIAGSPVHTTLKAAVDAAGLDEVLKGEGPYTVFAPTDAAFAALPAGTVEALLNDIPTLTAILTYHVVGAVAFSTDLSNGQRIATLNNGQEVTVTIGPDGIFINDAKVTIEDLEAENGVVHVINAVLLPESSTKNFNAIENVSIFPNPTANVVKLITPDDASTLWDIHIMDLQGRSMMKTSASHEDTIDTQTINSGTYILHITNGDKSIMKKLVKF